MLRIVTVLSISKLSGLQFDPIKLKGKLCNMQDWQRKVQEVYEAQNMSQLAQSYDNWATQYDQDINEQFGNYSPRRTVETFAEYVDKSLKILDAGAGTGLVGEVLTEYGYQSIEALELSQGMIEQAQKKGVYSKIYQAVLGESLDLPSNNYDAVIAKGVFAKGHAPAQGFDELIRITKPNGYIVFTIREDQYINSEYEEKISDLENSNKWELVEKTDPFNSWPKATKEVFYNIWVFKVLGD